MNARQSLKRTGGGAPNQSTLEHVVGVNPAQNGVTDPTTVLVEIFVSEHCFVCEYAHEVAATIRLDFPAVTVCIVDIHDHAALIPEQVFATPTYFLNGKLWSLGNPSPQKVSETLSQLVQDVNQCVA